nr:immunoglobulin heavy chain junction region [Macaca mulatta]MOW86371.1 immunoglobulin heavy chain junction region [Macaca mulatta]
CTRLQSGSYYLYHFDFW